MRNIGLIILVLIVFSSCKKEVNEFTVTPLETSIKGSLGEYISIVKGSYTITKVKDNLAEDWEISFKLNNLKNTELNEENYDIDFRLQLVDKNGKPIVGLKDFWMSTGLWGTASELKKLRNFIADQNNNEDWFSLPMEVKDKALKEYLPDDATHFIIRTELKAKSIQKTEIGRNEDKLKSEGFNINNLIGQWGGEFGDKFIEIEIEKITSDSIYGKNTVGKNTRPIKGLYVADEEKHTVKAILLEPGDNKYDGEFDINFNIKDNFAKGNWKSFKGNLERSFVLENSTVIMRENSEETMVKAVEEDKNESQKVVGGNINIDKMLNDYEKYVNDYIGLLKKAQNGDINTITQSLSVMESATNFYSKLEKIDEEQFTIQQFNRMNSINLKMTQEAMKLQAKMN